MKTLWLVVALLPLAACDPRYGTLPPPGSPDRFPSDGAYSGPSPFNDKNYADPHPQSDSDAEQRAAYIQHQKEQEDAAHAGSSGPDLSGMSCTSSSTTTGTFNNSVTTSHESCHN